MMNSCSKTIDIIKNESILARFTINENHKLPYANWHYSGKVLEIKNLSILNCIDKIYFINCINHITDSKYDSLHIISYNKNALNFLNTECDNSILDADNKSFFEIKLNEKCPLSALRMIPFFSHGSMTPWGGNKLRTLYDKNIPDDTTGESLEISAIPNMESTTPDGIKLNSLIQKYGNALIGRLFDANKQFPLLLKILDAKGVLSIQVHPDDDYAKIHENGKLGKEEAWIILDCNDDAKLIYGLKQGTSPYALSNCLKAGKSPDKFVQYVSIKKGDILHISPGTVHAIGSNIVLYEIQQSSDITYRMWDWGRLDKNGNPRQLHIDDSINCIKYNNTYNVTSIPKENGIHTILDTSSFVVYAINLNGTEQIINNGDSFLMLTSFGSAIIKSYDNIINARNGESILLPANLDKISIEGNGLLLIAKAKLKI